MDVAAAQPTASEREFAALLAEELALFELEDLATDSLAVLFALSAYLRSCDIDAAAAESALRWLRRALVAASGLSWSEEPMPLLVSDRQQRLVTLCHYTHGLIGRAAAHMHESKEAAVRAAMQVGSRLPVAGLLPSGR